MKLNDLNNSSINVTQNPEDTLNTECYYVTTTNLGSNYNYMAVFGSCSLVKGTVIAYLILTAILLLGNNEVLIHGIISEGVTTYRKMWEEFGISGKIDFIKNNLQQSKKIWIFADTVHLFKNIRNCLYNKKHLSLTKLKIKLIIQPHSALIVIILRRLYGREAGHPRCRTTNQINKYLIAINGNSNQ
ncbi:hypothetical protein AGLY_016790 [Aphis glycines]|uniref:DDE-1 domain-containing protein n=1 Tax=Aphis glycines TaxID=307491 RepID=A0A6G0SXE7_APHGL|nr:hypothetical protein AGLY_016790 [Aphis glycines]